MVKEMMGKRVGHIQVSVDNMDDRTRVIVGLNVNDKDVVSNILWDKAVDTVRTYLKDRDYQIVDDRSTDNMYGYDVQVITCKRLIKRPNTTLKTIFRKVDDITRNSNVYGVINNDLKELF